jgi:hypothetical protein
MFLPIHVKSYQLLQIAIRYIISAYKYTPDDPILIQNEKPISFRLMLFVPNVFCCKFVVNINAQTVQENKTKEI